jgi:hypothetical protein
VVNLDRSVEPLLKLIYRQAKSVSRIPIAVQPEMPIAPSSQLLFGHFSIPKRHSSHLNKNESPEGAKHRQAHEDDYHFIGRYHFLFVLCLTSPT